MSRKYKNLGGSVIGQLTVLKRTKMEGDKRMWLCKCTCGTKKYIRAERLTASTKSCGCLKASKAGNQTHPLYKIWENMRQKCYNYSNMHFPEVGGAGIKICERWELFKNFAEDIGPRPEGHIFRRIDDTKWFGPDNFIWVPRKRLNPKDRTNPPLTYLGKTQTIEEWAEETGLSRRNIYQRIYVYGHSVEKALTAPTKLYRRVK